MVFYRKHPEQLLHKIVLGLGQIPKTGSRIGYYWEAQISPVLEPRTPSFSQINQGFAIQRQTHVLPIHRIQRRCQLNTTDTKWVPGALVNVVVLSSILSFWSQTENWHCVAVLRRIVSARPVYYHSVCRIPGSCVPVAHPYTHQTP